MKKTLISLLLIVCLLSVGLVHAFAEGEKVYTITFDYIDDLDDYEENPFTSQVNGGIKGAGLIALDNWGSKKFYVDDDGELGGAGLKYTLTLTIAEDGIYTLSYIAHAIGNNASGGYKGEGDIIYTWTGAYEADGDTYVLAAPDAATFEVTGTLAADDPTAKTSFVPDAPFFMSSDDAGATAGSERVKADSLKYIMYGTTVTVSGDTIVSFTDSEYYTDWN